MEHRDAISLALKTMDDMRENLASAENRILKIKYFFFRN